MVLSAERVQLNLLQLSAAGGLPRDSPVSTVVTAATWAVGLQTVRRAPLTPSLLSQHFSADPVAASIMKIHTFNKDRERVKLGVDTIAR